MVASKRFELVQFLRYDLSGLVNASKTLQEGWWKWITELRNRGVQSVKQPRRRTERLVCKLETLFSEAQEQCKEIELLR